MMSYSVGTPSFTAKPNDHLTALPTELQHIIIGYLYATHDPDKAFEETTLPNYLQRNRQHIPAGHALDYLAATCRSLRNETMAWAEIFLRRHKEITKYKPLKTPKLQLRRNYLRGRNGAFQWSERSYAFCGLLVWSELHCVFCGKKTARSAILMNGLRCCAPCDEEQWPDKITEDEAKKQYNLKDHHLFPFKNFAPSLAKMLARHPGGLPKLRHGTTKRYSIATTTFLRKEVDALAKFAHGDLREHLQRQQSQRIEQERRREETNVQRDDEKAAMISRVIEPHAIFAEHKEDPMAWLTTPAPELLLQQLNDQEELGLKAADAEFVLETGLDFNDDLFMGGMDLSDSLEG